MIQRLLGGALVFAGCAGLGFMKAGQLRKEEVLLADSVLLMNRMENELSCRVTPLPALCALAEQCKPELKRLYRLLAEELTKQMLPNVSDCMKQSLQNVTLPESVSSIHDRLGETFGYFDLDGQLRELEAVKKTAEQQLKIIQEDQKNKMKTYQTLGLCAGASLVILLV